MHSFLPKLQSMSAMTIAIWLSVVFHLGLLSMHFEPELKKFRDNLPVLEVMLVNAKTQSKPDNTATYAQANLDRGGNTELDRKMKTALPALTPQKLEPTPKPVVNTKQAAQASLQTATELQQHKRVAELEEQAQELMTQMSAAKAVVSKPAQKATKQDIQAENQVNPSKKLDLANLSAAALEIEKLEAIIAKQQDEYQKRPKRKFVGGRTKEYRYALYVEAWRQKVEKIGNLNYPEAARDLKLYGQLQMTVSLKPDGSVESIEINRSSGHKVLDAAAKHIVELGSPYAVFPEDIRKEVDVLSITRTWTFTQQDSLATE
jgi:protein TonB